jgi:hypothetical protein
VLCQEPILPTIESYNASVVNFDNATGSVLKTKNFLFYFEKRSSLLAVNSKAVRLTPGIRCVVNFYSAGVVTQGHKIGSRVETCCANKMRENLGALIIGGCVCKNFFTCM